MRKLERLKEPRMVVAGILAGGVIGYFSPYLTASLSPLSILFFSLLKMCALPIVITAVILSFARLWERPGASEHLLRMGVVFALGIVPLSLLGVFAGVSLTGRLVSDPSTYAALSKLLAATPSPSAAKPPEGILSMMVGMVPKNIFQALSGGEIIGTLIFVILFGVSVGFNKRATRDHLIAFFEALNEALFRMVSWITYFLPFALCALTAQTVERLGGGAFAVFGRLIGLGLAGCLLLFILQLNVIRLCLRASWKQVYLWLREPCLVALSTSSSLASLPSLEMSLQRENGIPKQVLDLLLPVGITFCQHSCCFFDSLLVGLVAKLYGLPIGPGEIALIVLGSYLQSLASAGLPAAASAGFLSSVFRPMGLPVEALEAIYTAVMPLMDPVLTLVNVSGQVTSASLFQRLPLLFRRRKECSDANLAAPGPFA